MDCMSIIIGIKKTIKKYNYLNNIVVLFKHIYIKYNPFLFSKYDKYWIDNNKKIIDCKISSYCIFISSKNNYEIFNSLFLKGIDPNKIDIYNIDDNSDFLNFKVGEKICKENKITFLKNEGYGLQLALNTLKNYLKIHNTNYSYILYMSHDNYPIQNDFYSKLDNFLSKNNEIKEYGCIGFNHIDYKFHKELIARIKKKQFEVGFIGRNFLTKINSNNPGWIDSNAFENKQANFDLNKPIKVDAVCDMGFLINCKFIDTLNLTDNYRLFCWADDICLQFMNNNIRNVSLLQFLFFNVFEIKSKYSIPYSSVHSAKKKTKFHCEPDQYKDYWKNKWGWDRDEIPSLELLKKLYNRNSLIYKIRKHNFLSQNEQ